MSLTCLTHTRLLSISTFLCLRILLKDRPHGNLSWKRAHFLHSNIRLWFYDFVQVIFGAPERIQAYGSCCFGQGGGLAANCLRDKRGRKVPVESGGGSTFLNPFQMNCFNLFPIKCSCFQSSALVPSNCRVRRGFCGNVEAVFTSQINVLRFFCAKKPELWEALVIAAEHASVWLGPTFFSILSRRLFIGRTSIVLSSFSVIHCTPFTFKRLGNWEWGSFCSGVCVRNLRLVRCSCLGKNLWKKRVGLSAVFPGLSSEKLSQN